MSTLIETSTGSVEYSPSQTLPPRSLRGAWTVIDDGNGVVTVALDPNAVHSIMRGKVNQEWDNRVFAGFGFGGKTYAADRDSITNVAGAVSWAQAAMSNGVQAGNLYWQADDPSNPGIDDLPFAWKANDGSYTAMDAPTVEQFGIALARHKQKMFLKAQALKAMVPIPDDYAADSYWT